MRRAPRASHGPNHLGLCQNELDSLESGRLADQQRNERCGAQPRVE